MKFSTLEYFLAVAQELNISKASKKLYITQQSLSEQISRLEKEYHVKLFERNPQLQLTYAGERMKLFAEQVLNLEKQFKNEMADLSLKNSGALSIGIRGAYSRILLPRLLTEFHKSHPNIHLKIISNSSSIIAQMLSTGQLDLALGSMRLMNDPSFASEICLHDRYCIVIPENILRDGFQLTPEQFQSGTLPDFHRLSSLPLLLLMANSAIRSAADYFLSQYGIARPNIYMECRNNEPAMLACAAGLGVTFSTLQLYKEFDRSHSPLYAYPFDTPTAPPHTSITYYADRPLSQVASDFIDIALHLFSEKTENGSESIEPWV